MRRIGNPPESRVTSKESGPETNAVSIVKTERDEVSSLRTGTVKSANSEAEFSYVVSVSLVTILSGVRIAIVT